MSRPCEPESSPFTFRREPYVQVINTSVPHISYKEELVIDSAAVAQTALSDRSFDPLVFHTLALLCTNTQPKNLTDDNTRRIMRRHIYVTVNLRHRYT